MLYRYFNTADHAISSLRESRLKASKVSSFNDPFECMFIPIGTVDRNTAREMYHSQLPQAEESLRLAQPTWTLRKIRHFLKDRKSEAIKDIRENFGPTMVRSLKDRFEILDKATRVICFSEEGAEHHDEILMWAHYADGHCGVRIAFDLTSPCDNETYAIRPVDYNPKRIEINLLQLRTHEAAIAGEHIKKSLSRKSSSWAYEREHRLFISPESCERDGNLEFAKVEKECFSRVDIGAKCPEALRSSLLSVIRKDFPHVICFQADYHATDYALCYEPIRL